MILGIILLLILSIIAIKSTCFLKMTFMKHFFIAGLFSGSLLIHRVLTKEMNVIKIIIALGASAIVLLFLSVTGYYFFEKLCPERKKVRYIYFTAYLIFVLALCSQYPFSIVLELLKPAQYKTLEQETIEYYRPVAEKFGIKELHIKLIEEKAPGAFVMSYGEKATVVVTRGLYELLDKEELAFVMAHEFSHFYLDHHRRRLLFAVITLLLFFIIISLLIIKLIKKDETSGEFLLFLKFFPLMLIIAALLSLFPLGVCRQQEFEADLNAVKVTQKPEIAISAFEECSKSPFYYESGSSLTIFEIHPTVEQRVERIKSLSEQ